MNKHTVAANIPLPKHKVKQNKAYEDLKAKEHAKDSRANPPLSGDEDKTRNTGKPK